MIRRLLILTVSAALLGAGGWKTSHVDAAVRETAGTPATRSASWGRGVAVGYWTKTWLTGCVARGRCVMACGGYLDDRKFTVAVNPALHLGCGQRITVCQRLCRNATVTDRTASVFTFEFTYALSRALGQPASNWAGPRSVRWRRGWIVASPGRWVRVG